MAGNVIKKFHTSAMCSKVIPSKLKGKDSVAQKWLVRQVNDPYVQKAKDHSYRCRSAFKLLEIDDKFDILKPGFKVIDCGAAPGSWSQVAVQRVNALREQQGKQGKVISIDREFMFPVPGTETLSECDITDENTRKKIEILLQGHLVDVVMSDIAPHATGIKSMDHERIVVLCKIVMNFAKLYLRDNGTLLFKLWQGAEQQQIESLCKQMFAKVNYVKPAASRTDSAEVFLLSRNFKRTQYANAA